MSQPEESGSDRLIVLAPTPPPVFGHSVLALSLLASLRRLGLLAAHVDTRDDRSLANLNRLDLENVRLGLLAAWRLIGEMRRHRDAAVYVQISQGTWGFLRDALWIWLARAAGRRVYVHLLGGRFQDFHAGSSRAMRALIRATVTQAHAIWVLTPSLRGCFDGLVAPDRVMVLQCVAEDPMLVQDPLPPRRGEDGGLRVLFLSNLREGKGHMELLEALARLGSRAAGWHVRLVGESDERPRAAAEALIAERIDPSVRIEIPGPLTGTAKARELAWASVFALPTSYRNEGQPLVVIEAMAAGLPILATTHRGVPDTVGHEREAILVQPGDVAALATALERLAGDAALRGRLGAAARYRYEELYQPSAYDRSLGELLARDPKGAPGEDFSGGGEDRRPLERHVSMKSS